MTIKRLSRSLRARLVLLVGIIAAAVIAIESYLEIRTFQRTAEEDRLQVGAATAQAVADDLELGGLDRTERLHTLLHEFLEATPAVRDIAVLTREGDALILSARTSSAPADSVLPVARQALDRRELTWSGAGRERTVAVPVMRGGRPAGAVIVSISVAPVEQLAARGRQVTLWFAIPAIVVLTILVDLLVQRFVHRPISAIRRTMRRAGAGEVGVRTSVERPDEIGDVAEGLNEMLRRLERFHTDLQSRIDEATGELRGANEQLVESYQRIFALREALARAEEKAAVGQMAANVAHEIGTPLNLISGYVQVMKEEARTAPRVLHQLQTVEAQIGKVTDAIRTMLDYARRPALQRRPVDLAALVEQVCEVARPALHAANVKLGLDVPEPLPPLFADPVQLELALFNLVSNSLDAMPAGGRLDIIVSATEGGIRLVVADSGTGIPPEILPRVFEPWVTTKPAGRGTGLGLSITRDTVTGHGGTIDVRSDEARGTIFTIDLPVSGAITVPDAAAVHRRDPAASLPPT